MVLSSRLKPESSIQGKILPLLMPYINSLRFICFRSAIQRHLRCWPPRKHSGSDADLNLTFLGSFQKTCTSIFCWRCLFQQLTSVPISRLVGSAQNVCVCVIVWLWYMWCVCCWVWLRSLCVCGCDGAYSFVSGDQSCVTIWAALLWDPNPFSL